MVAYKKHFQKSFKGFTLLEAVGATMVLAIATTGLLTGLNMGIRVAKQAKTQTLANQKVMEKLEEKMALPYVLVPNGTFVDSLIITQSGNYFVEWVMTTTVSEVTTPIKYKEIIVDSVWEKGGKNHYRTYKLIKSP